MDMLSLLNVQLNTLLNRSLPQIEPNWWRLLVLEKLTYQQQSFAQNLPNNALDQLDLSALLRVIDQNWYELANLCHFGKEARNWLKEAQSIRNRWAHAPAGGLPDDMIYRDIDTIERLLLVLGADTETLDKVTQHKRQLLKKIALAEVDAPQQHSPEETASPHFFKLGDIVCLKVDANKIGAISNVLPTGQENRYQVFHDGVNATYYESQLTAVNSTLTRKPITPAGLHAAMTALQLRHPSTTHLYSLFASRINFVPYQFRPVLKLIQADRPRMLIADEVGVGKTIEAGLILKELQARRDTKSVLVICPKALVAERKWQQEMKRFDERFEHLDGAALRYCLDETHLDGIWPQKYARAILPYSLLDESLLHGKNKQRGLLELEPPPVFDLVIVDEAHTIRNTDTWAYRNVRYFCDNAEAVLLLSATPIQMGDHDLYNLLNLLRPDVITNKQAFQQMAAPNPHLNAAIAAARTATVDWKVCAITEIDNALATAWGRGVLINDPRMQQVCDVLLNDDDRPETRLALIRQIEELITFAPFINRTRRRDIGTTFTLRKPETVTVDFTPQQAALHSDLVDLLARMLTQRHGDINLKFMLSTVRRQISSCVFGLAPMLHAILNRHFAQLELSDIEDEAQIDSASALLAEFRTDIDVIIKRANQLTQGEDPKLQAFLQVITDKQALPNNKLLVFTSFRHTWEYLYNKLQYAHVRVGLINGQIPDDERRDLRDRFGKPKADPQALDVLLSSEVGCEGLDYQFCDALVNYDLPWNPMRVEQRIGRIDRYGQQSPSVVIYNFITPGTVDADIYERCLLRIGLFQQALGGSEEILGRLTKEIKNIAENFTLTAEEQANRLQQLSDNEIRALQEQAKLEEEQSKLFGLSQPQHDEDMIKQASSFWLTPVMLANLISHYLHQLGANNIPASLGQKPVTTLQIGQDIREKLLTNLQKLKLNSEVVQTWTHWLKGNDPYLALTFSQQTAAEQRALHFITPNHPLAQQASQALEPTTPLLCNLTVSSDSLPQGQYPYAIYRWQKRGLKEDFTFQPIATTPQLTAQMLTVLESAQSLDTDIQTISNEQENRLEQNHYQLWQDARATHIEHVQQHARARLDSLKTTHTARMALVQEQHDANPSDKIQRMRSAQMDAAERDYQHHKQELEQAAQQADILAEAVTFGILIIEE
ncbi:MAG: DEAD/DEAH box helicase [Methylococcaceae bacterium]|nr:MAG: DEAD/DEAH box helicase [Methylococcaceae bacterium]